METQNNWGVPIAIVIAGVLIAGAVIFKGFVPDQQVKNLPSKNTPTESGVNPRPVTSDDHIIGNPNADVVIIEYSDTECPFCKSFHSTMRKIMDNYGKSGQIAWVYRHSPIQQLHPKAPNEAMSTECVNEIGGPAKFWEYLNKIYETTTSNNRLDIGVYNLPKPTPTDENGKVYYSEKAPRSTTDAGQLTDIAVSIGIDKKAFESCMSSNKYKDLITKDISLASSEGVQGTPSSVIISKDGIKTPIAGAQPYETVKQMIDIILTKSPTAK